MELCALCVLPSENEYSFLNENAKGRLPPSLRFVAPQRFVTSSLVQTLSHIDNLLLGTELEIHTTASKDAVMLKPTIKGVRELTLPYMSFEYCNVYRGTYGAAVPWIHRHPDAVVILWNKGDYDHVFFVTMSQLLPCLKDMKPDTWSMIVFWSESGRYVRRTGPDVGLDFTDQPVPAYDENGDDGTYPGYDDPVTDEMPVDDEDMPPPVPVGSDLDNAPVELQVGGGPPPHPPGGGSSVPVPGGDAADPDLDDFESEDHGPSPPPRGGPSGQDLVIILRRMMRTYLSRRNILTNHLRPVIHREVLEQFLSLITLIRF